MRNEAKFKSFYTEATEFVKDKGVEVSEPRQRKVSWRLDDNWHTEYVVQSYEENLRVNFFYEVLDTILNEFQSRIKNILNIFREAAKTKNSYRF